MAKGLPKWAIKEARARGAKNVFAYAWTLVKRKGKGSRKSNPKTKRRGGVKMARRKRRSYRRSLTIPLAPVAGLGSMVADSIQFALSGDINKALLDLRWKFTGIDYTGRFYPDRLVQHYLPLIAGLLIHKFVGGAPLNLNRTLARHKIPLIRI